MSIKQEKKKKLAQKLLHKYRLVILNEDTFEERFAIKLTRLNVFVIVTLSSIVLIIATILLIAFTPLREYVPGYSSVALQRQALELNNKTDSLVQAINLNEKYLESIKKVLKGDLTEVNFNKDSIIKAAQLEEASFNLTPSKEDSLLRAKVDQEDKYNLFETAKAKVQFVLFAPVNGTISQHYNEQDKHFAVDVVVAKNTPVKATADGTIILAEWTSETGFVIIIDHGNGLLSVYKHNASTTKEQGELVKAGEVIAISGNTGELTSGPHLHFELWSNGYPINPVTFIDFE